MAIGFADTLFMNREQRLTECDNCGETSAYVVAREHTIGSGECPACFIASMAHGRHHVAESHESIYVIAGYTGDVLTYADAFEAQSAAKALQMAADANGTAVRYVVWFTPIVRERTNDNDD